MNLLGEYITFSHWKRVSDTLGKVQRIPFTYSSLLADNTEQNDGIQRSLFKADEQRSILTMIDNSREAQRPQKYAVVDIEQVWREEKEDG